MRKPVAYIVIGLAGLLGGGSLIAFMIFLYTGALNLVDAGLAENQVLWLDAGLSLAFFIQHSVMIRKAFRRWLNKFIPEVYNEALYAIASGAVLLMVVILWQKGTPVFMVSHNAARWAFRSVFCLSLLGFIWGALALKTFDPFGIRPIFSGLRGAKPRHMPFIAKGPYRLVRHPLYLFSILIIWSCPDFTTDRLLLNLLWTAWIIIGAHFEERDLTNEFGDTYRKYRMQVPMLIPSFKKKS